MFNLILAVCIGVGVAAMSFLFIYAEGTVLQLAFVMYGAIIGPSLTAYLYAFMPFINNKVGVYLSAYSPPF